VYVREVLLVERSRLLIVVSLVGNCEPLNVVEELGVVEVFAECLIGISGARLKYSAKITIRP